MIGGTRFFKLSIEQVSFADGFCEVYRQNGYRDYSNQSLNQNSAVYHPRDYAYSYYVKNQPQENNGENFLQQSKEALPKLIFFFRFSAVIFFITV